MSLDEHAASRLRPLILDVPNPPPGIGYAEFDDFQNREILGANGIGLSVEELMVALDNDVNVLQAAAAHRLGEIGERAAIGRLVELAGSSDDLVKVEAGYALARMGEKAGVEELVDFLEDPLEGYISAPLSAGCLARLGDARGWPVIVEALGSRFAEIRMIAAKQLSLFLPFDGRPDGSGGYLQVRPEFARALRDASTDLQWQVLSQLHDGAPGSLRSVLETYRSETSDPGLRHEVEGILGRADDWQPARGAGAGEQEGGP